VLATSLGNTGHPTFPKKYGFSKTNTMVFCIGIGSAIIHTNFSVKKTAKNYLEVFLNCTER
jgi:hypothetical protein